MLRLKRTSTKISLAVLGAIYLTIFSNLELSVFFKGYAAIIPVQLLALTYSVYLIYIKKASGGQHPPS